jgi:4'-phosphopantetheinyl transferase
MKSNSVVFGTRKNSDDICDAESARPLLDDGDVHLWYEVLDPTRDAARLELARSNVTTDEWQRCHRFIFDERRRECLATRLLVRSVLSRYVDVSPSDWRFGINAHGRPEIDQPAHARFLRFNLSHSDGVVACVVSSHHEIGVDLERIGRRVPLEVAESHFAASELDDLRTVPRDEQPRRFLEYWTLKEAYMKARGAGLSLPLRQCAFDLSRPARPIVRFSPGLDDDAAAWQFERVLIGEHLAAVAARRGATPVMTLSVRRFDSTAGGTAG